MFVHSIFLNMWHHLHMDNGLFYLVPYVNVNSFQFILKSHSLILDILLAFVWLLIRFIITKNTPLKKTKFIFYRSLQGFGSGSQHKMSFNIHWECLFPHIWHYPFVVIIFCFPESSFLCTTNLDTIMKPTCHPLPVWKFYWTENHYLNPEYALVVGKGSRGTVAGRVPLC